MQNQRKPPSTEGSAFLITAVKNKIESERIYGTADTQINEIIMIDNETSKFCLHSAKRNVFFLCYDEVMKCYRRLARVHVFQSILEANNAIQPPRMFIFSKRKLNSLSI